MIVDFKTDRIAETQVNERADKYRPQMDLYARAVSRMWRKPIRHRYLVFLSAQRVVDLGPHGESVAPQSQERGS